MEYLLKIKPIEPYAFSSNISFKYNGVENNKTSYIVPSKDMPEQTTILGMVRYLVLKSTNSLKFNFDYSFEEKENMNRLIGKESFDFEKENQDFGAIKSISPVFLINNVGDYIVRAPFFPHKKEGDREYFLPFEMEDGVQTSLGIISLPKKDLKNDLEKDLYSSKDTDSFKNRFINLSNKELISDYDIFKTVLLTGNKKTQKLNKDKDDSFFKKEKKLLNDDYSFAVFVDIADNVDLTNQTICQMGSYKSSFCVTAVEKPNDLEPVVKKAIATWENKNWYYLLSDSLITKRPNCFAVVEQKEIKNIHTKISEINLKKRLIKSTNSYNLTTSGSIFYGVKPELYNNENLKKIGYNYVIKLSKED